MTYEKFEFRVLGMLLDGNDPRLERLLAQTWDTKVLSRDETDLGFNIKLSAPPSLAINETAGRIFGVEAKLSETEIINLELIIKDGLIDCLKGTSTSEMSYGDIVKRYKDFTFSYKNEESSEVNFHLESHDEGVTEVDANIPSGEEAEKEEVEPSVDAELIHEPFILTSSEEVVNEVEQDISSEDSEEKISETTEDSVDVTEEPTKPITEEDDLITPPSFNIPKIPEAIRESFDEEDKKAELKNLTPKELSNPDLEIENPIDIAPEELESEALSAVNIDEVNRSIALMEKKSKELRIITIMIVLVTIITIGFIISIIVNS